MLTIVFSLLFVLLFFVGLLKRFAHSGVGIQESAEQEGVLGQEFELNEIERLSIGWPRGVFRIGLMFLMLFLVAARLWDFYFENKWFHWNGPLGEAVVDSFCIVSIGNILPILGFTLWQWGQVTVDKEVLRIPRIRKTLVFSRGPSVQIRVIRGFGGSFFHCALTDGKQSARFHTDAQGLARLYSWSLTENSES